MRNLCFLVLMVITGAGSATAQGKRVEEQIRLVERQRFDAMVGKDTVALQRLLGDDLSYAHTTGDLDSKTSLISRIVRRDLDYTLIQPDSSHARIYGNTAINTGTAVMKVGDRDLHVRFTEVYVLRRAVWQLVAWQSVRLP